MGHVIKFCDEHDHVIGRVFRKKQFVIPIFIVFHDAFAHSQYLIERAQFEFFKSMKTFSLIVIRSTSKLGQFLRKQKSKSNKMSQHIK